MTARSLFSTMLLGGTAVLLWAAAAPLRGAEANPAAAGQQASAEAAPPAEPQAATPLPEEAARQEATPEPAPAAPPTGVTTRPRGAPPRVSVPVRTRTNAVPRRVTPPPMPPVPGASSSIPRAQPVAPASQPEPSAGAVSAEGQPAITPPPGTAGTFDPNRVLPAGTLQFQAAPLEQVLTFYAELSGRTILRPSALPDTPITLKTQTDLTVAEALEALDSVLALNNITMIPIGEKFVTAVPSNQALQEAPAFSTADAEELPEASQYITKIVTLKHAVPSEAAQLIQGFSKVANGVVALDESKTLILRDYAANIKRMLEVLDRIDQEKELDYTLEVIPIKYGKVEDIYATMNALIGGGGAVAAPTASAGRGLTGGTSAFRGGSRFGTGLGLGGSRLGGYGGYGGYSGGYGGGYRPYQAATGPATSRSSSTTFSQRLRQIVSRASGEEDVEILKDARIVPDERSNSLIVFANKEDMMMITNIVSKVDQLLAQVLIEATVMDVSLSDEFQFGVSSYLSKQSGKWRHDLLGNASGSLGSLTNLSGGGGLTWLGNYNDEMTVLVQAIASTGKGQIIATPRIQTSHAKEGSFSVGETVPYVTSTYYGGSFYGPSSSFQQLPVFTTLNVIPYITPDGLVVMDIVQEIQEISGFKKFENVGELPQTINRSASATVSVRDGDTIILGGYIRMSRSRNNSGVPILKDIPLLGSLFRSKSNKSARSEMVVFIRPTVLPTPTAASQFAERERRTLPGVSEMDTIMQKDQDKLRRATDRLDSPLQKP